jgi:hypothetical protein
MDEGNGLNISDSSRSEFEKEFPNSQTERRSIIQALAAGGEYSPVTFSSEYLRSCPETSKEFESVI